MSLLCIGHRGAKGHLPENTLPSFEKAISLGCPWIELDVHLVENELVVMHDRTVDRTTNGSGKLKEMTLSEVRKLDAGDGAQVPLLSEVMALARGRAKINIELKGRGTAEAVSGVLDAACNDGWDPQDFLISSFWHEELSKADKRYHRGVLYEKLPADPWDEVAALEGWSINLDKDAVTESIVRQAHDRGYPVLVYTVNEPADIARVIACGVDGVFSDYPERVFAALA